mmetsp:Transcript_3864/g.17009  ORF Transcript_3864/g.17009 Transcript_3864/m.17009 type:complete len:235 (-) Transcript_3864:962-1666(-)
MCTSPGAPETMGRPSVNTITSRSRQHQGFSYLFSVGWLVKLSYYTRSLNLYHVNEAHGACVVRTRRHARPPRVQTPRMNVAHAQERYLSACSVRSFADAFASRKRSPTSSRSPKTISSRPLVFAITAAGVSSCTACLRDVASPISPSRASDSSSTRSPSTAARTARIFTISSAAYGSVRMMTRRSRRSTGTPCGADMSVPLISQMPRLVAKMTMGAREDSSARLRYVKHSMSSM